MYYTININIILQKDSQPLLIFKEIFNLYIFLYIINNIKASFLNNDYYVKCDLNKFCNLIIFMYKKILKHILNNDTQGEPL